MADLALGDQLGQGADGVLDGGVGVDAVLVVQVDAVAEPSQGASTAVRMPGFGRCRGGRAPPAWEIMPNLVATTTWSRRPPMARPTSSSLVKGPDLGSVEEGDALPQGSVDGATTGVVAAGAG